MGAVADLAVEDREDLPRQLLVAGTEDGSEDVRPVPRINRLRMVGDQPTYLAENGAPVGAHAGAHVLRRRVLPPQVTGHAGKLVRREAEETAVECHETKGESAQRRSVRLLAE